MERLLFDNLSQQIKLYLPEVKTVRLWNEQIIHSNGIGKDGRNENPFQYPAVFLQFQMLEARDLSAGCQEFDMMVTTHLAFKSFQTEDTQILDLKEKLYYTCQRFQQGNFARMSRVAEQADYNHDDVQVFTTEYRTRGIDDNRYVFQNEILDSITGMTITDTIVDVSGLTYSDIYSGTTYENGNNQYGY